MDKAEFVKLKKCGMLENNDLAIFLVIFYYIFPIWLNFKLRQKHLVFIYFRNFICIGSVVIILLASFRLRLHTNVLTVTNLYISLSVHRKRSIFSFPTGILVWIHGNLQNAYCFEQSGIYTSISTKKYTR